ncbi:MAG: PD-(D/E)XK nuclease family protein [Anaerolineales bacterium]|nr:PD-(D/E)XK nuclease family protein [Anaerolineales bacterium]
MLERLRAHPIFQEIDSAKRHHKVPYYLPEGRGVIDLLYRTASDWFIIDFKTDEVRSDAEAQSTISREGYDRQVARYAEAVLAQLGIRPKTMLVFLQVETEVKIYA